MQTAPRPVRSDLGDTFDPALLSSLSSDFPIQLTRGGWTNPAGLPRGTLQRVAYRIEEDELVRYHWNVLDRTFANEPIATVLLDGVESLEFLYYQANGEVSQVWPPQQLQLQQGARGLRLRPRAVEIILRLTDQGEIRRLLEVAP